MMTLLDGTPAFTVRELPWHTDFGRPQYPYVLVLNKPTPTRWITPSHPIRNDILVLSFRTEHAAKQIAYELNLMFTDIDKILRTLIRNHVSDDKLQELFPYLQKILELHKS